MKQTIIMELYEEKKHSIRYNAKEKDAALASIYVSKTFLGREKPEELTVTIETGE